LHGTWWRRKSWKSKLNFTLKKCLFLVKSFHNKNSDGFVEHSSPKNSSLEAEILRRSNLCPDGWILGGGDRAPARGPRIGLIVLHLCPDSSSLGKFFAGCFFTGKFFARMILRWRILRPDNSSPENSSLEKKFSGGGKFFAKAFFARMILLRRIIRYSCFLLGRKIPCQRILHPEDIC
jgi:hypothetical protein